MKPFDRDRRGYDAHEFFADEFACAALMPPKKILSLRDEGQTPEQMALFFDVPIAAVKSWLERLDTHPPEH